MLSAERKESENERERWKKTGECPRTAGEEDVFNDSALFDSLFFVFLFSLHGWIYAFYDYKAPLKLSQCPFVGFKWFRMFFSNETQMAQLWQVMKNTFAMSFLVL